jgi:hypothetical protein
MTAAAQTSAGSSWRRQRGAGGTGERSARLLRGCRLRNPGLWRWCSRGPTPARSRSGAPLRGGSLRRLARPQALSAVRSPDTTRQPSQVPAPCLRLTTLTCPNEAPTIPPCHSPEPDRRRRRLILGRLPLLDPSTLDQERSFRSRHVNREHIFAMVKLICHPRAKH